MLFEDCITGARHFAEVHCGTCLRSACLSPVKISQLMQLEMTANKCAEKYQDFLVRPSLDINFKLYSD